VHRDDIRKIVKEFKSHRLTRRQAVTRMAELGLSLSAIWTMLDRAAAVPAGAAAAPGRGTQGTLKLLFWQAPTIVNLHLANGTKDQDASRIVMEPLLTVDTAGNFTPVLAAEVPSVANGGVSKDGRSVTYKLKEGVKWADGRPFTADDVVFTYQYVINKQTAATTYGNYTSIAKVEPLGQYSVKITFKDPTPFWYIPFVGANGAILPRHALDAYVGSNARNAPYNLKSFGTGPYMVDTFRPGDIVIYKINPYYRDPNKPAFSDVQMKGGGDAVSAARAVLETGEYDYAWNLQVEWPVLDHMLGAGKGVLMVEPGSGVECLYLNETDPNKTVDGQRSSIKTKHPFLSDVKVRQALALAVDRQTMATQLYGQTGDPSPNLLTTPTKYYSKNTKVTMDLNKANSLLDEAGWKRGPDGVREKNGIKMEITYVTSVNSLRQKEQQIVKEGWEKVGGKVTLQSVDAGVFFSSSPGNNDTIAHFYRDVEMFTDSFDLFPSSYMEQWYSGDPARDLPQKENNWSGQNFVRWQNAEYNKLYDEGLKELDPEKNTQIWIKANDIAVEQVAGIPLINRKSAGARAKTLDTARNLSAFDVDTRNIADWRRTG
jgi:peptide/nickel transport system substrate-binding protein